MRIIRHRAASAALLSLALSARGDAGETDNAEASDITLVTAAKAQGAENGKIDPSLQAEMDLQDAIDSGGLPGCFDPSLSGRNRAVAERLGGVPCEASAPEPKANPGANSNFEGYWTGPFDGGNGAARIFQAGGPGRYDVDVSVAGGGSGCSGTVVGSASSNGNRLVLRKAIPGESGQCVITFTRNGSSLIVEENRCSSRHGASCEFSGTLAFQQAEDPLAPPDDYSE